MSNREARRRGACAGCGQPAAPAFAPFCSQGCKDRDLLTWLSDGHRIPGRAIEEDDEEAPGRVGFDGLDRGDDDT